MGGGRLLPDIDSHILRDAGVCASIHAEELGLG